ncbi:MAG TPA: 50S ribosomal protein L15 [Candidatus Paceibacterota bacterium]|nr:50S ribosomal protein L15 [Candidatus Paceibacterota bacterium]
MQIHNITREHPNSTKKRVGRGGKRGKTSGRGTKGQKARAGAKLRPELRDLIKKIPKQRGYRFHSRSAHPEVVNVSVLESFNSGERVTPTVLLNKNIIRKRDGKLPQVKILGGGDLSKKLEISKCEVSESAKKKIESAGGKVV